MAYRTEYPRPQLVREEWINLNGEWDFEFDLTKSKFEQGFLQNGEYNHKIKVPFCPESKLSGIENVDFIPACWYKKYFDIPSLDNGRRLLLHFGAVDYKADVYINNKHAVTHVGGYSSFTIDITDLYIAGKNTIVVYVQDDVRSGKQPRGKQSHGFYSSGCDYTRTTGIWQTVWLEIVPSVYIKNIKITPDLDNQSVQIAVSLSRHAHSMEISASAFFNDRSMGSDFAIVNGDMAYITIKLKESHAWDIGQGLLYDLNIKLNGEEVTDVVKSYFGLRNIYIKDNAMYLNNRPVFQRLVLDQGFYPDGIYTAPTDEHLIRDIEISQALGFNGARLHEKVFEERFLYHADKLGYIVWGEHANWGLDVSQPDAVYNFLPEWLEVIERDYNHPSIIGWCPFNETWDINGRRQYDDVLKLVYLATKAVDPVRPVIDTSGNFHVITDIYDVHDYDQNIETFTKKYTLKKGEAYETHPHRQKYSGQPFFVSEYGGARWSNDKESWGYGEAPKTQEEFAERYAGLTTALMQSEGVCAFCYTQLYDIEQEKNGLYDYDRNPKFDMLVYEKIRETNMKKAKIEC